MGVTGGEPVKHAIEGARQVRLRLTGHVDDVEVVVRPMVVMWGPGRVRPDLGWQEVGDVLLCDGPEADRWLRELDGDKLDQDTVAMIETYLMGHLTAQSD